MAGLSGRRAGEAGFDPTGVTAAVAHGDVPVVALLGPQLHAVAAAGDTARARLRAGPSGLEVAPAVATVSRHGVPIVAGLGPRDDAVAAAHGVRAGFAGRRADPVGLGVTIGRASVIPQLVAVVAGLGRRVQHAVSTERQAAGRRRAIAGRIERRAPVNADR